MLAAYIFIQPYLGVDATKVGSYGAAGSALGTGAGVLVGLIYMIFMYLKKKNTFVEEKDEEASERVDSYQEIFRMIMHIIAPIILATCVYNLVTTIDMYIFYFAQSFHHIDKNYLYFKLWCLCRKIYCFTKCASCSSFSDVYSLYSFYFICLGTWKC